MKGDWWTARARRLQEAADQHDIRAFCQELMTVHGPNFKGATALKDGSGNTLLTEPSVIVQCWADHFEQVWTSIIDNALLEEIPQQPTLDALTAPIHLEEVQTSIKALKNGKAPGADGLAPAIFKQTGPDLVKCLHLVWNHLDSRGSSTGLQRHYHHTPIQVLRDDHSVLAESLQPENQCCYRTKRGTVDIIFAVRKLQKKFRKQN